MKGEFAAGRVPSVRVALLLALAAVVLGACSASTGSSAATSSTAGSETSAPATSDAAPDKAPSASAEPISTGSSTHRIAIGDSSRTFRTYVPERADLHASLALVVMLHGGTGTAEQAESTYQWNDLADTEGFAVVYPDGVRKTWNAGTCCGFAARTQTDDVAFISQIVDDLGTQLPIDSRRVYVTGISNGAMLSERLLCETTMFAAAALVAGGQMVPCVDPAPASVLQIHGLADENVPFDGSPGNGIGKVPAHLSITDSIAAWRSVDTCDAAKQTVVGAVTRSHAECADGRAVDLVTIAGAGHQWPGSTPPPPKIAAARGADPPFDGLDATEEIWKFFRAHPAPA